MSFNRGRYQWTLEEQKKLLECYKSETDWPSRSSKMYQQFPARRQKGFFSPNACQAEFDRLMSSPCPGTAPTKEGHAGYSIKAVVDMWIEHLRKEISKDYERQMELYMVEIRNSYALVDRLLSGKPEMSDEQLLGLLDEARKFDAKSGREDAELVVSLYMDKLIEVFQIEKPKPGGHELPPTKSSDEIPRGVETAFRSPSPPRGVETAFRSPSPPPPLPPVSPLKSPIRPIAETLSENLTPEAKRSIELRKEEIARAMTPVKRPAELPVEELPSPVKRSPVKEERQPEVEVEEEKEEQKVEEEEEIKEEVRVVTRKSRKRKVQSMEVETPPTPTPPPPAVAQPPPVKPVTPVLVKEKEPTMAAAEVKEEVVETPQETKKAPKRGRQRGKTVVTPRFTDTPTREETASPSLEPQQPQSQPQPVVTKRRGRTTTAGRRRTTAGSVVSGATATPEPFEKREPASSTPSLAGETPSLDTPIKKEELFGTCHVQTDISIISSGGSPEKKDSRRQSVSRKVTTRRSEAVEAAEVTPALSENGETREVGIQCMRMELDRDDKICVIWRDNEKPFVPMVDIKKEPIDWDEVPQLRKSSSAVSIEDEQEDRRPNKIDKREITVIYDIEAWAAKSLLQSPAFSLELEPMAMTTKRSPQKKEDRTREENLQIKSLLLNTWRAVHNHRHSGIFSHPVSERDAPGYSNIVKQRMDLQTLKKEIESGQVTTPDQLKHRLMRMFANAVMFNSSGHDVNAYAKEMARDTLAELARLIREGLKNPMANHHPRRSKIAEEHSSRPTRSNQTEQQQRAARPAAPVDAATVVTSDSRTRKVFRRHPKLYEVRKVAF